MAEIITLLSGVASTFENQYCHRDYRFNGSEVLRHVHAEEEISGIVVYLAHSEVMIQSDGAPSLFWWWTEEGYRSSRVWETVHDSIWRSSF